MSMKVLKKGEVFNVVPESNGIVFAFSGGQNGDGEKKPSHTTVFCKHYNFVARTNDTVSSDVFKLVKFGANYEKIIKYCTNYVMALAIILNDSKVFMLNPEGDAFLFDDKGEPLWKGIMKYKNKVPAAIALTPEGLWGAFPDFDAVVRFNTTTMRSELRIGKKGDILACPKGIFADGKYLFVSSYGSKKLIRIDTETFDIEDIYGFKEPIYSYLKVKNREFVNLESGLYEI